MHWTELDKAYPKPAVPDLETGRWSWSVTRAYIEYLLTSVARGAVGLDADPLDLEVARGMVGHAYREAFMTFGFGAGGRKEDSEYWKSVCALLGAALNDAELVATCTGGKTLGAKVQKTKAYSTAKGHDLRGLARHLATAARAKLPASHVEPAMTAIRADFAGNKLRDPRVALVAAHAWLVHVAVAPDLVAACKAWLDGQALELPEGSAVQHVADGEDPRAKIFERFAEKLANEGRHESALADLNEPDPHAFTFRVFLPDGPTEAAVFLFLARQPLPAGWEAKIDPVVARWLGGEVSDDAIAKQQRVRVAANREYHNPRQVRAYVVRKMSVDPAVRALHLGDKKVLTGFTGGGTLAPFKPGKYFKDDWRKLLRYLGAAAALPKTKRASRADVEPAWFDFLAREFTDRFLWSYLLAIQAVITVTIGGGDPRTVGEDLRRVVTGV